MTGTFTARLRDGNPIDAALMGAVQVLIEKSMLTGQEEKQLLEKLPFGPDDEWIQLLYRCLTGQ